MKKLKVSFSHCWVFSLLLALTSAVYAGDKLLLDNFGTLQEISYIDHSYWLAESHKTLKLNHKLIVKAQLDFNVVLFMANNPQVLTTKTLYTSPDFIYYLFEIEKNVKLTTIQKQLITTSGVLLVQPDLLVFSDKNTSKINDNYKVSKYSLKSYLKRLNLSQNLIDNQGAGVDIAIIDDGVDLTHKEFNNLKTLFAYDAKSQSLNAAPKLDIDTHGTKIAGIIFAAHNEIGIDGIAPKAQLIAIRQPDTWTSNTLLSFQLAKLSGADVINCSWNSPLLLEPIADVVNDLSINGRNSKGIAVVFAAGNNARLIVSNSTEASLQSAIVVGSRDFRSLKKFPFSNYGQSVDLYISGNKMKTTSYGRKYSYFAGTSLSAAIVSGLSALILSQHPEFTLTQLQEMLIKVTNNNER